MFQKTLLIIFCILLKFYCQSQLIGFGIRLNISPPKQKIETGKDVINKMYQKYRQAPCKSYTFSQKNTHYRNDSIIGNSEWHEYIEFPDKFRIDFGETTAGNFVIFKNDSSYSYKKNELIKTKYNTNTLLLLLGGMYYRGYPDVITRLEKEHYFIQMVSTQKWKEQTVYVVGATKGDTTSNQIWVNKKNLRVVRIIEKMENGSYIDMTFDAFQKNCDGYVETKVTFKNNGKIEQVEEYYNIKPVTIFAPEVFNLK